MRNIEEQNKRDSEEQNKLDSEEQKRRAFMDSIQATCGEDVVENCEAIPGSDKFEEHEDPDQLARIIDQLARKMINRIKAQQTPSRTPQVLGADPTANDFIALFKVIRRIANVNLFLSNYLKSDDPSNLKKLIIKELVDAIESGECKPGSGVILMRADINDVDVVRLADALMKGQAPNDFVIALHDNPGITEVGIEALESVFKSGKAPFGTRIRGVNENLLILAEENDMRIQQDPQVKQPSLDDGSATTISSNRLGVFSTGDSRAQESGVGAAEVMTDQRTCI